jgi:hypothetical protein
MRTGLQHRPRHRLGIVLGLVFGLIAGVAGTASAGSGATIYTTDFSDPAATSAEWGFPDAATTVTGDGYGLATTAGALTISLDGAPNLSVSPAAGSLPDDQVVEATIAKATGHSSVLAGVVCRGSLDDDLGYAFLVATDGFYTIGAYAGPGAKRLVNAKGTKRTDAVDPAGPNTVRGECRSVGKKKIRLTLFVNDRKVASAVDRTSPSKIGPDAYLLTEVAKGKPATATFSSFAISAG